MKQSTAGFIRDLVINFLAIFLGIIITFAVQARIDRSLDKKDIRAALELVRNELAANVEDIETMSGFIREERRSAEYLLAHKDDLSRCPADSVNYHGGVLFADASISVSDDALEMLKSSSLFQKIGDSRLSMKIVRAYDSCNSTAATLTGHVTARNGYFAQFVNTQNAGRIAPDGRISVKELLRTDYGLYAIRQTAALALPENYVDLGDVEEALSAIDNYLRKGHRLEKNR